MKLTHLLIVIVTIGFWGCNFVAITLAVKGLPPIFFSVLSFLLVVFPTIFFVERPRGNLVKVINYGLVNFGLQFAFLFSGLYLGASAGISSVLLQLHLFVSIGLAMIFLRERANVFQLIGAMVAFSGVVVIAMNIGDDVSIIGCILVVLAAVAWGSGNFLSKSIGDINIISLVVWGSMAAIPPLFILSLFLEGPTLIINSIININQLSIFSVIYQAYIPILLCYVVWSKLLELYSMATVAPLSLLSPVFGMLSSVIVLHEEFQTWKLIVLILILSGVGITIFGQRLVAYFKRAGVL